MIIACDFDNTIVKQHGREYDDIETPLEFLPGALEGLQALRRAGHVIIVWSGRANRAIRLNWRLNPMWVSGAMPFHLPSWEKSRALNEARYQHMVDFILEHLDGVVQAIDDGRQGKPPADIFIDDRAMPLGDPLLDWATIAQVWGEQDDEAAPYQEVRSGPKNSSGVPPRVGLPSNRPVRGM